MVGIFLFFSVGKKKHLLSPLRSSCTGQAAGEPAGEDPPHCSTHRGSHSFRWRAGAWDSLSPLRRDGGQPFPSQAGAGDSLSPLSRGWGQPAFLLPHPALPGSPQSSPKFSLEPKQGPCGRPAWGKGEESSGSLRHLPDRRFPFPSVNKAGGGGPGVRWGRAIVPQRKEARVPVSPAVPGRARRAELRGEAWAAGRPHGTRSGQQDVTALFREFRLGALLRISIE